MLRYWNDEFGRTRGAWQLGTDLPVAEPHMQRMWRPLRKGRERRRIQKFNCMPCPKISIAFSPLAFLMRQVMAGRALHSPCLSPSAQGCETNPRKRQWRRTPPMAAIHAPSWTRAQRLLRSAQTVEDTCFWLGCTQLGSSRKQ